MAVVQCHLHDLRARLLTRMGRQHEAEEALATAFEATRRVIGPNWAVTSVYGAAAEVAEYRSDRDMAVSYRRRGLDRARRGAVGLHVGMFGMQLVPFLLDDGDHHAAAILLDEAETALQSVNRLDEFSEPLAGLRRCQIAHASGHVTEAATRLAELLPVSVDDPSSFALVIEQIEAAGLILASVHDPHASSLFAAVDRWVAEATAVPNPIVIERRARYLGGPGLIDGSAAPELAEAMVIARRALKALAATT